MSISEVTVRRQKGVQKTKAARARRLLGRKKRGRKYAKAGWRPTGKQKALYRKRKATGFYKKVAALRASLNLPATITGSISHRQEYINLILETAVDYEDDAREFAKMFLKKDPAFSNTDTGMAALLFEAYIYEKAGQIVESFIETIVEGTDTTFLALFVGKIDDEQMQKLKTDTEKFVTVETLVKAGDVDHENDMVSDVTILEGTPKRGVAAATRRKDREAASEKKGLPEDSRDYQALLDDGGLTDNAFAFLFPDQRTKALDESTGLISATDPNGVRWFEHKGTWLPDPSSFPDETVEETMTPEEKVTKKAISNYMKKRGLKVFFKTSKGKARFMQVYNWRNAGFEFPADMRNKALDAVHGGTFTRNKDNPVAGNVTTNSITMKLAQWGKFLGSMGEPTAVESVEEGYVAEFTDEQRAKRFALEIRPHARSVRVRENQVYYEAREMLDVSRSKTHKDETPTDHKDLIEKCRTKHGGKKKGKAKVKAYMEEGTLYAKYVPTDDPEVKGKKQDVALFSDPKGRKKVATYPWHYTKSKPGKKATTIMHNGQRYNLKWLNEEEDTGIVAIAQDHETDYVHRFDGGEKGEVTVVGFDKPMNIGPLYLESTDGFQSKFTAWTVRKDGTDDGKVLIHVNDKMYSVPISLEEVKGLLDKMEEFYADLPSEFDVMVQAFMEEYAEDNGIELSHVDIESRGCAEAVDEWTSHDFIAARDARVSSASRMRLMALDEQRGQGMGRGGSRQGDGGVTTCVCPSCGTTAAHARGTPCTESKCPKCGATMVGEATTSDAKAREHAVLDEDRNVLFRGTLQECKDWMNASDKEGLTVYGSPDMDLDEALRLIEAKGESDDTVSRLDEAKRTTEFECQDCNKRFKAKVGPKAKVKCPKCGSEDLVPVELIGEAKVPTFTGSRKMEITNYGKTLAGKSGVQGKITDSKTSGELEKYIANTRKKKDVSVVRVKFLDGKKETVNVSMTEGTRSAAVSGFVSDLDDAKFGGKGATTKTVKCPVCGSKVLAATGYCVKCKKKTIKAEESVDEIDSFTSPARVWLIEPGKGTTKKATPFKKASAAGDAFLALKKKKPKLKGVGLVSARSSKEAFDKAAKKDFLSEEDMEGVALLDEASVFNKDSDVMFDAVAAAGTKDPGVAALAKITKKAGTKRNFEAFKAAVKKVKDAKARKALYTVVNGIEKGKYKAEFKNTFGGKPGRPTNISQVSTLFDQINQAAHYDEFVEEVEVYRYDPEEDYLEAKKMAPLVMEAGKLDLSLEKIKMSGEHQAFKVLKGKSLVGFLMQTGKTTADEEHPWKAFGVARGKVGSKIGFYYKKDGGKAAALKAIAKGIGESLDEKTYWARKWKSPTGEWGMYKARAGGYMWTDPKGEKHTVLTTEMAAFIKKHKLKAIAESATTLFQVVAEEAIPEIEGTWRTTAADGSTILTLDEGMEDMTLDQALSHITRGALKAKRDLKALHIEPIHLTHARGEGDEEDPDEALRIGKDLGFQRVQAYGVSVLAGSKSEAQKVARALKKSTEYRSQRLLLQSSTNPSRVRFVLVPLVEMPHAAAIPYVKNKLLKGFDVEITEEELEEVYVYTQGDYTYSAHKIMPTAPKHQGKFIIVRKSGKSIAAEREVWTGKAWVGGKQAELESKGKKYEKKAAASADIKKVAESVEYKVLVCQECADVSLVKEGEATTKCPECASESVKVRDLPLDEARAGAMTMKMGGRKITEPTHMRALAKKAGKSVKKAMEYWGRAQERAEEQYPEIKAGKEAGGEKARRYYKIVTAIFKNMLGLGKKAKAGESVQVEVGPLTVQFECSECGQEFERVVQIGEVADGCTECGCNYATLIDSTEVAELLIKIEAEEPVE